MKHISRLTTLAVVAVVALVLGSFGPAVAGSALTKGQVKKIAAKVLDQRSGSLTVARARTADSATTAGTASAVKDGSITGASVKDGSLGAADLTTGLLPRLMWARVGASAGVLQKGAHAVGVTKTGTGRYDILFDQDTTNCGYAVTATLSTYGNAFIAGQTGDHVFVYMKDPTGTSYADFDFSLLVMC